MAQVIVIEDERMIRERTLERLQTMSTTFTSLTAPEIPDHFPAERMAQELNLQHRNFKGSYTVLVLDLHLGNRGDDGLEMMRYLQHCWDGAVVLHSSQVNNVEIRRAAVELGIRFGCTKLANELESLVEVAREVAFIRSATLGAALYLERIPIPPWKSELGIPSLLEYLEMLKSFGRRFDGTLGSVDWELVDAIERTIRLLVDISTRQSRFLAEWNRCIREMLDVNELVKLGDQPFYFEEWWINTVPVQMALRRQLERALEVTAPLITFQSFSLPI